MSTNLMSAHKEWATRPDDQRFWDLDSLRAAVYYHRQTARTAEVPYNAMDVRPIGSDGAALALVGPSGKPAKLTHWAFGQLARNVGAPADYLRNLPADLAATNLKHGLAKRLPGEKASLLLTCDGSLTVRAATTDSYSRIWDVDVVDRLISFTEHGWRVPPARPCREDQAGSRIATEEDCRVSTNVKPGDLIAPAGLYASDHDVFIFMVNPERRIQDGSPEGLSRGFFVSNSEVGAASLKVTTFLYRFTCGNHIVWDASQVNQLRIVHRGDADERFRRELYAEVRRYADGAASEDEQRIAKAQAYKLGDDKDSVLDSLFKALRGDVSRKALDASYVSAIGAAERGDAIDPNTAWGMAQGITYYSQETPYMDERAKLDKVAGKVLAMAF